MCTNERRQLANRERDRPWVFLESKKREESRVLGKTKKGNQKEIRENKNDEIKEFKEQKKSVAFII